MAAPALATAPGPDDSTAANEQRERFALTRAQLLEDYAQISSKRRGAAAASAIRHQSGQYLDILAVQSTNDRLAWSDLRNRLTEAKSAGTTISFRDAQAAAEIGRVLMVRSCSDADVALGTFTLELAVAQLPKNFRSRRFRMLLVQQYILSQRTHEAAELIEQWPDIKRMEDGFLVAELHHPARSAEDECSESWLAQFNQSFVTRGLAPIELEPGEGELFDRVIVSHELQPTATASQRVQENHPLVSVVLTAYRPGFDELRTSVRSILNQTISETEIIIVNDASGVDYDETFAMIASMDSRIRVLTMPSNGGTYAARNRGFSDARGQYITGQDDDDWSHPERLAHQVRFMESHPETVGCRISGIMCTPNLSRLRLGYQSINSNASSLMIRRETFELAGGFIEMRKAADTEFMHRIEVLTNSKVEDLPEPLSLVRILQDSLSRSEFKSGWSHPARRQVKSSYKYWHASARKSELTLPISGRTDVYIPRRFRKHIDSELESFDVIIAGDWRQYGGPQKSMIEEIRALRAHGFRTAVLHLEAPRFMSTSIKPMTPHIQELINSGEVDEVLYDDAVRTKLLILRYPPILQFAPDTPSNIEVERMFVMANQAPSERDGSDIRYLVRDCHDNAQRLFTPNVSWVPQGPQVREAIEPYLRSNEIESFDLPGIVDTAEWSTSIPKQPRSLMPVVGRHSRDNAMKWPSDAKVIEQTYPTSGLFDVRIMGGSTVPQEVLARRSTPPAWTVFPTDALPVPAFLRSLDFYIFYQNDIAVEAFGRAILEAIASNLVVILPPHYEPVFGEAALYAEPANVISLVRRYHEDRQLYTKQQERAAELLQERFSHHAFVARLIPMICVSPERSGN